MTRWSGKTVLSIIAAIALVGAIAACSDAGSGAADNTTSDIDSGTTQNTASDIGSGTTENTPSDVSSTTADDKPVTIDYWFFPEFKDVPGHEAETSEYGDWEKLVVAEYEKAHPNVTVNTRMLPYSDDGYQAILNAITADDPPDVVRDAQLRISQYASLGALADLSDAMSADDKADFGDSLQLFTYDGALLAIPHFTFAGVLMVNQDLVKAAGVSDLLPTEPGLNWTFDDFRAVAEATTTGQNFGVALPSGGATADYLNREYMVGAGARLFNQAGDEVVLNSAEGVKGLQFMVDLVADGLVPPGSVTQEYYDAMNLFLQGRIAMFPGSNFSWGEITTGWADGGLPKFAFDAVSFPSTDGKAHPVSMAPTGVAVFANKDDAQLKASKDFAAYITSAEQQKVECLASGQFPFRTSLEGILDDSPGAATVSNIISNNPQGDLGWKSPYYNVVRPLFFPQVQAALLGDTSPKDALDTFAKAANAAIADAR